MTKSCTQCSAEFEVTDEDLEFYKKASPVIGGNQLLLNPPKLCPECRRQRRLCWRNERTMYKRPCGMCNKTVVSIHAEGHPYPVYCNTCYWSEKWDPRDFGKPFDPSRSFLEQFYELYATVPQRAMVNENGITSQNCEYTIDVPFAKNCYMCFGMWKAEDCMYCRICDQSKFCVDCEGVKLGSELVYDSVDSQKLYHCSYLQNSESCTDCTFGFDLKGCKDCIACFGLRQKQYCIFNTQYSKEDYHQKKNAFALNTRTGTDTLRKQYENFIAPLPRKCINQQNCEDCHGDHLFHCKDVLGFVCTNAQYSKWIERSDGPVHSYDQTQSGNPQWCLECVTVDNGYNNIAALYSNQSKFVFYSENCFSCESLLGCISLRKNSYCILNKQYSEDEFAAVATQAIKRMQTDGEFGEFFAMNTSPFAYNETNAFEFYPLTKEQTIAKGLPWTDNLPYTTGQETMTWDKVPQSTSEVTNSLAEEVFACQTCSKNFRIVLKEIEFYKKMDVPLPHDCPNCRNAMRLKRRNPVKLYSRSCAKCSNSMETTFSPDRPEIVYCEKCYLETVY